MATKLEFLVAKLKVVLALATISVAISSPAPEVLLEQHGVSAVLSAGFSLSCFSSL